VTCLRRIIARSTQVQSELDLPGLTKIENFIKQPLKQIPSVLTSHIPFKFKLLLTFAT
jgi:hypothetical protein